MNKTLELYEPIGPAWHVTAEYRGKRYFVCIEQSGHAAEMRAKILNIEFSRASFFIGDYFGSQSINGDIADLRTHYRSGEA